MTSIAEHKPAMLVIEPRGGIAILNLRDLWEYGELLYFLAWRDVKVRYKQTVLGATWAIIQLLFSMVVSSIVLAKLGKISSDGLMPLYFYLTSVPDMVDAFVKAAELDFCGE